MISELLQKPSSLESDPGSRCGKGHKILKVVYKEWVVAVQCEWFVSGCCKQSEVWSELVGSTGAC